MERSKLDNKSDKEILDEFGELVAKDCFDPSYANLESLRKKDNPPKIFEEYVDLFKSLSEKDFDVLKRYLKESIEGTLHDFLRIFEENTQFKIHYEEGERQVDLNDISEMLKSEPLIQDGWIERFSKEI